MGFWSKLGDFLTDHTPPGALIGAGVREGNYWKNLGESLGKMMNPVSSAADTFQSVADLSSGGSSAADASRVDSDTFDQLQGLVSSGNELASKEAELNRDFQQESANTAMQFSASEAEKNRQWQTDMSNTAYQRAVQDMRAAGLNPALMYASGAGGASTPSGDSGSSAQAAGSQAQVDTSTIAQVTASLINTAAYASNSQLTNMTSMAKTLIPLIVAMQTGDSRMIGFGAQW